MSDNIEEYESNPVEGDLIPWLPDGEYRVSYVCHITGMVWQTAKVTFWFKVQDFGEHFGKIIPRYFNAGKLIGKKGKGGHFKPPRSGDFVREYADVFPNPINRLDRISLSPFEQNVLVVQTRTVSKDREQKEIAKQLRYTVVDCLKKVDT